MHAWMAVCMNVYVWTYVLHDYTYIHPRGVNMINWLDFCAVLLPMYHWCYARTSTMILARPKTNVSGQWWSMSHISPSSLNKSQKNDDSTSLYTTCGLFCWNLTSTWLPSRKLTYSYPTKREEPETHRLKKVPFKNRICEINPWRVLTKHKMLHTEISNKTSCVIN